MTPARVAERRLLTSHSEQETLELGVQLAQILPGPSVLCLWGDLGAGKTLLSKGIIHGKTQTPLEEITSPTYIYLNLYGDPPTVAHFDLYRLRHMEEFLDMAFDEYFTHSDLCLIEWPERILPLIPSNAYHIRITAPDPSTRLIDGCPPLHEQSNALSPRFSIVEKKELPV